LLKINHVVKIKDANFDGTMIKELCLMSSSSSETSEEKVIRQLKNLNITTEGSGCSSFSLDD